MSKPESFDLEFEGDAFEDGFTAYWCTVEWEDESLGEPGDMSARWEPQFTDITCDGEDIQDCDLPDHIREAWKIEAYNRVNGG